MNRPGSSIARVAASPVEAGRAPLGSGVLDPGLRLLIPGWTQLRWGQADRGVAHLGSFLASVVAAVFCWGTLIGWISLGFASLWQLTSIVDVLRHQAFPVYPRRIAWSAAAVTLGLVVHVPLATMLWLYAWPMPADQNSGAAYLVDRLAFREIGPSPGQWIWTRDLPSTTPHAGRVVAVAGQEVEYTGRAWRVDGAEVHLPFPGPSTVYPDRWRFRVPRGHVLMGPDFREARDEFPSPLVIVAQDQIVGRAWARYYPIWDRGLL